MYFNFFKSYMVMLLRVYFIDTIEIKAKDIISYYLKKILIISD